MSYILGRLIVTQLDHLTSGLSILESLISRYCHKAKMIAYLCKYMKYLFTMGYEYEKERNDLIIMERNGYMQGAKTRWPPKHNRAIENVKYGLVRNSLFISRGVVVEARNGEKKRDMRIRMLVAVVDRVLRLEIKEVRAIVQTLVV